MPVCCFVNLFLSLDFLFFVKDGHLQMRKKLYVPRVEDKNSNMRMLNISRLDDLIANSMDILEPAPVDGDGNEREDGMVFCLLVFRISVGHGNISQ